MDILPGKKRTSPRAKGCVSRLNSTPTNSGTIFSPFSIRFTFVLAVRKKIGNKSGKRISTWTGNEALRAAKNVGGRRLQCFKKSIK